MIVIAGNPTMLRRIHGLTASLSCFIVVSSSSDFTRWHLVLARQRSPPYRSVRVDESE
jgi:hypothetical protein